MAWGRTEMAVDNNWPSYWDLLGHWRNAGRPAVRAPISAALGLYAARGVSGAAFPYLQVQQPGHVRSPCNQEFIYRSAHTLLLFDTRRCDLAQFLLTRVNRVTTPCGNKIL